MPLARDLPLSTAWSERPAVSCGCWTNSLHAVPSRIERSATSVPDFAVKKAKVARVTRPRRGRLLGTPPVAGAADGVAWWNKMLNLGQPDKRQGSLTPLDTVCGAPALSRVGFDRLRLLGRPVERSTLAVFMATMSVESARLELVRSA